MSQTETRMALADARKVADAVVEALRPYVERVEVAGSVRRREPVVGDIEVLAIPRAGGLFAGGGEQPLDEAMRAWSNEGRITFIHNGERSKRFTANRAGGVVIDLNLTDAEGWGVLMAIRTGPAGFSKAMVTQRMFGGHLPNNHLVRDRRIWRLAMDQAPDGEDVPPGWRWFEEGKDGDRAPRTGYYQPIETPEERDVLELTMGRWIEPHQRRGPSRS